MKNVIKSIFFVFLMLLSAFGFSQNSLSISPNGSNIQEYVRGEEFKLSEKDIEGLTVTNEYYSKGMDVTLVYVGQEHEGIPIYNAITTVAIKDGEVFNLASRLVSNVAEKVNVITPIITAEQAIEKVASHFELGMPTALKTLSKTKKSYEFSNGNISSRSTIPVKLKYVEEADGSLRLYQDVEVDVIGSSDAWSVRVDAVTGEISERNIHNYTISCAFGNHDHNHSTSIKKNKTDFDFFRSAKNTSMMVDGASYRVLPVLSDGGTPGVSSPIHGDRSLINNPANVEASPFGWHDIDGIPGAEYTITRGNNVFAYLDTKDSEDGDSPNGGDTLEFDFPYDYNNEDPKAYRDAAVTNLFYVTNMAHDVFYRYGFDEAAGNFQENNYSNVIGKSDSLNAEAQDAAGTNNANMRTDTDGVNPIMQMYLYTNIDTPRDSDFDNEIIIHEYGHGISTRLVGGPFYASCLNHNTVKAQQGEGWSDWFGLMMTMNTGDLSKTRRGIGTFSKGQAITGNGLRNKPYSTDFSINDYTYDDIKYASVPHGVGTVWATMLWDLTWAYIDKYGFSDDLYHGDAGNNKVLQLVLDGLKLQPCGAGFVDSRDAILAADRATTGGENACLIWEVFAKRGLGFGAQQGAINSAGDGQESFDLPEAAFSVTQVKGACGNGIAQMSISNFTNTPISSLEYSYTIDGGSTVNETWSGNIGACQTGVITILDSENISRGIRKLEVTTLNSVTTSINLYVNDSGEYGVVNTFENDSDELIAYNISGENALWERGIANGTLLKDTGSKVYGTNLDGNTERSVRGFLVSQCYDLSTVENASVEFKMGFDTEKELDFITFEYSVDGGVTWQILGNADDKDWFNNGDVWNGILCELCVGGQWTGEGDDLSTHSAGGTNAEMKLYKHSLEDFDINGSAEENILFRFVLINNERGVSKEGAIIDDFVVRGDSSLSIQNLEIEGLEVFPNPTTDIVTIQSSESLENAKVSVIDIMGRVLTNVSVHTMGVHQKTLSLRDFASGIYVLNIESGSRKSIRRIMKE
ncbi:MAG: M36 family metallopeptidase [Polaribacter sp.]|uniref:M36 family metallopeptidase n=1 Tax=Polaribacter sp. TaxID=1920175 RepID=UPI003264E28C